MKILPEPLVFEWDKGNTDKNLIKHKVTNREAEEVFDSEPLILLEDAKHSSKEKRFQVLGKTNEERLLSIIFTIRKKVRIISARDMNKKERRGYEKEVKTNT